MKRYDLGMHLRGHANTPHHVAVGCLSILPPNAHSLSNCQDRSLHCNTHPAPLLITCSVKHSKPVVKLAIDSVPVVCEADSQWAKGVSRICRGCSAPGTALALRSRVPPDNFPSKAAPGVLQGIALSLGLGRLGCWIFFAASPCS